MKIKTWIVLLLSLLAFTARAAVIPIKITDFPRTNTIPAQAIFLVAITNSVESTNYGFTYTNLFRQITGAIPAVINSFTNGSNFFIAGSDWTNISGYVRLLGGSTNTARFATNNNRGMLIGDEGIAVSYFGWPADGLSYLSVYDGSTGHLINRWVHGVMQPSTTNGSYASVISQSGVNPSLTEAFVVTTNGVIASEFDINMQRTGAYLLLGGNVNEGFVGIQHGAQVSTPIGGNLIRAKWGTLDRFFLSTNGNVSFFGSHTNYGNLYARSNFVVIGTTLLNGTLAVGGPALFLNGLGSTGITNTIGFQTLGRISLGDDPSDLTTSSNEFRQYGPIHIHNGGLYLQDVTIPANRIMYLTAGRLVSTITTVDPTEVGFLDGVTSPISSLINNPGVVTNIIGVGIGVSSNGGNWTITDLGAGGAGNPNTATNISGGGSTTVTSNGIGGWTITSTAGSSGLSMWTNVAAHSVLQPIAGSTNFIGGGTLNAIATNTTFATVGGGSGNLIGSNVSWATIGGGLQNQVGAASFAGTVAGGRGNIVSSNYTTIGGGFVNLATDRYATIGGGFQNTARDENATIAGGADNLSDGKNTTIGGGINNRVNFYADGGGTIGGGYFNVVAADFATVGGGALNNNQANFSFTGGGYGNAISGNGSDGLGYGAIGGGASNRVGFTDGTTASGWGTIGGGAQNWIRERGEWSTIGGGRLNIIEGGLGVGGTIAGGMSNLTLSGSSYVTIGGGYGNLIVSGAAASTISGGSSNTISTNSTHAMLGGGRFNTIQDSASYSAILGGSNNIVTRHSSASVIGGGVNNTINTNADYAGILSGSENVLGSGANNGVLPAQYGFIGGGRRNVINSPFAVIGGGEDNIIEGDPTRAGYQTIAGGHGNNIGQDGVSLNFAAYDATIGGGSGNNIQYGAEGGTIAGGVANVIRAGNTNAVISGGYLNTIINAPYGVILGGEKNILGSSSPSHTAERGFIVGSGITMTNPYTVGIGYTNSSLVLVDKTNLHLIGNMKIKMTNGAFGGYVLTSDDFGNLTLQAVGGGSGGGGGPSSSWIASSNGFGTNTAFYGSVTNYGHLTVNSNLNISSNGMTIYHTAGAPFSIYQHPDNYLGTRDDGFKFAYNLLPSGPVDTNEPSMYLGMEANYDTGVAKFMEVNWDYLSASGIGRRALGYQVDRTNHSAIWQLSGRSFAWVNYTNPANTNLHQLMDLIDTGRLTVYSPPGLSALITAQSQTIDGTGSIPGFAWSEGGVQKWYLWHMGNTDDSLQLFNQGVVNRLTVLQTGNIGIGTNLPTAQLHVVGNNAANALVLQAGTTNKPSLMTLSTNGLFTVPSANIRTNVGTMDVTTNLFVLGTRVTNGTRRIFVGASAQLNAAAAGTAKITLYVENAGSATNRLSVSAGPLASLTTVEALFMAVSPGSIYYFADETSGAGATVALVPETCSVTAF